MGCRFPGGVTRPEQLWELLAAGTDAISRVSRRPGLGHRHAVRPRPGPPGTSYTAPGRVRGRRRLTSTRGSSGSARVRRWPWTRSSGCCSRCPGRRIERAGIDPASLRGTATGVFAGASGLEATARASGRGGEGHLVTGTATSVISGRVSYALGLEGPAVTVDTACSSSLVALHLACQALRAGECDAGAGRRRDGDGQPGRRSSGSPGSGGWPHDGRCKAFGAAADGMGLAEGAGMVLLERLSDARRNGHRVLAVVRGQRGEPGRGVQRADRAERAVPAAGDPRRAGQRGAVRRRRGRGGGARDRDRAGRPDRGAGADRHLRAGPARRTGRCGWGR